MNDALLAGHSATATLQAWCEAAGLAAPVRAERLPGVPRPLAPDLASLLDTRDLRFRHVRLRCGPLVLSEAENWYVPARLTAAMNHALESTDAPFGRVAAPLRFRRRTLEVLLLPPGGVFAIEHQALLLLPDGAPLGIVRERTTREAASLAPG